MAIQSVCCFSGDLYSCMIIFGNMKLQLGHSVLRVSVFSHNSVARGTERQNTFLTAKYCQQLGGKSENWAKQGKKLGKNDEKIRKQGKNWKRGNIRKVVSLCPYDREGWLCHCSHTFARPKFTHIYIILEVICTQESKCLQVWYCNLIRTEIWLGLNF